MAGVAFTTVSSCVGRLIVSAASHALVGYHTKSGGWALAERSGGRRELGEFTPLKAPLSVLEQQ